MLDPSSLFSGSQYIPEAELSLPVAFDRAASAYGSRLALVSDKWQLTYDELNASANHFARSLLARGSARGDRVAVLMDHDISAVVAILAGLKAGCIVVPINVTHPSARLRQVIERTSPTLMIIDADHHDLANKIAGSHCSTVVFAQDEFEGPYNPPAVEIAPDDVAILISTSGSTGGFKVVMCTHRHLLRQSIILSEAMALTADDRIPLFGAIDGGQGRSVMFSTLLSGSSLHPFPVMAKGVTGLASWMLERQITAFISSTSIFRNFSKTLDHDFKFKNVRLVRLASESATEEDVRLFRRHFTERCMLVHTLNSSETGNVAWSRYFYADAVPDGRLSVGLPSRGHQVLIVGEDGEAVSPGEVGEIVVRSRYIARGYWDDPEMTAARFSGALDGGGVRQFRTGDLGRVNDLGQLEFYGRKDSRVKIRGYRIELAYVEQVVRQLAGIQDAVVESVARPDREPMLIAFVTLTGEHGWSHTELRRAVRNELPDYMVPSRFVVVDRFPLTTTGKIDRQQLKHSAAMRLENQDTAPPLTATEAMLAEIWRAAFESQEIDRDADFFEFGGDSLIAAVVAARVHAALGVELDLGLFADHPTLSALSAVVEQRRSGAQPPQREITPISRAKPAVLSSFQERAWRVSRTPEGHAGYVHVDRYRLEGTLDIEALRGCLDYLVGRHESLRTTFALQGGRPVQIVHPPQPASFEFIDLTRAGDVDAEIYALTQKLANRPIDLRTLPLLHFFLAQVGPAQYWLLRHRHHIISDAWSANLYFQELTQLYSARIRGDEPPLPETQQLQYADYAAWQRKTFDPSQSAYRDALAWWKNIFADSPKAPVLPFRLQGRVHRKFSSTLRQLGLAQARDPADGIVRWGLDHQTIQRLRLLSRATGASFYVLRLAAYVALLADECQTEDVILTTYVSTRNRPHLQTIYGLFVNLVRLRFRCDAGVCFRKWIEAVRRQMLEFSLHSEISFDQLREGLKREGVVIPNSDLIFNVADTRKEHNFSGIKLSWVDQNLLRMPSGLTMHPDSYSKASNCRTLFDAHVYDPIEVRRFVERYQRLLVAISRNPDLSISKLLSISHQEIEANLTPETHLLQY